MLRILSIGGFSGLGESNTCTLRTSVLKDFGQVDTVDTTARPYNLNYRVRNRLFRMGLNIGLPDLSGANKAIVDRISSNRYDIIWIDKGIVISTATFKRIKELQPQAKLVGYSPDWMMGRHNQSRQFLESLPYYDCYVTTKSYAVNDMLRAGCRDVLYIGNAFQRGFHRPYELSPEEMQQFGSAVSFIGAYETERATSILYLAKHGIQVNIWGSAEWEEFCHRSPNLTFKGTELLDADYCKALSGSEISLCFLRKVNKDLQTTRSVEIPACRSMMLAERTSEHQQLFEEGKEAVYFSSDSELLEKCRYYLDHPHERKAIRDSGYERCIRSDYSYHGRINQILHHVMNG